MKHTKLFAALTAACVFGLGASALNGSGTQADPYRIADTGDYAAFAALVNDGTFGADGYAFLTADLDFTDAAYTVVGTAAHPFEGYFDGCGHTLDGISITSADEDCLDAANKLYAVGVFSFAKDAHIEDLHIENMTLKLSVGANTCRGALLCGDYRATTDSAENGIFRCAVQGTLDVSTVQTTYAGGIVGSIETSAQGSRATVSDCKADIDSTAAGRFTVYGGGMAAKAGEQGYLSTLQIKNCVSAMRMCVLPVDGRLSHEYVGGMVGNLSINSDWQQKDSASLSADEPELDGCVTTAFAVTSAIDSASVGDLVGYYSDSLRPNCYTASDCLLRKSSYAISGKSATEEQLASAFFWTGLGYDLTDVWALTDDGIDLRKAEKDTFTLTYEDGTLTADISALSLDGTLVMALYDASGRLTDARTATVTGDTETVRFTVTGDAPAAVRFFVIDGTSLAPLADLAERTVA